MSTASDKPVEPNRLKQAYAECRRLARKHYENFPTASFLVPRDKRDALAAIYAFARSADDFADEYRPDDASASQPLRLEKLAGWRQKLSDCFAGRPQNPIFIALADCARRFDLSPRNFENLLRAFESDVLVSRHQDFRSLLDYCSCSANPVGRLVLELFIPRANRDPGLFKLSDCICTALQLANFWQDVRVDLERDRVYLPVEDLRRFRLPERGMDILSVLKDGQACSERSERNAGATENWKRFLAFQIERTRDLFMRGIELPDLVPRDLRVQLRLTWLGGMEILYRIESAGYDVLERRPSLSKLDFLALYFRARGRRALAGRPSSPHVPVGRMAGER